MKLDVMDIGIILVVITGILGFVGILVIGGC